MNKLNKLGMELLEYKIELNKGYSNLVLRSLNSAVDTMFKDGLVDTDIHFSLKEKSVSFEDLKELLLTKDSCLKTEKELLSEYEEIRNKFNELLELQNLEFTSTKSEIDKEILSVSKSLLLNEDIFYELFYIKSEDEFEKLMERKNFFEKFAVLRLPKLLHSFIENIDQNKDIYVRNTNAFFHQIEGKYGISLVLEIKIDALEDNEKINEVAKTCLKILNDATEFYNLKIKM